MASESAPKEVLAKETVAEQSNDAKSAQEGAGEGEGVAGQTKSAGM